MEGCRAQARLADQHHDFFRTKRDSEDWARRTEHEMVRGVYIERAGSDHILVKHGLNGHLREVSSTENPSTHSAGRRKADALKANLSDYSLAAITSDLGCQVP